MAVKLEEAVGHVSAALQLSTVDAAAYVRLCMGGPRKVSEIAAAMGVHRNDVYRSLERLAARGLVETTLENPARYLASDPLLALDGELDGRLSALSALQARRERIVELVGAMTADAEEPASADYRVIQGRQEIASARRDLIASAKREVLWLSTTGHALAAAEFDGTLETVLGRAGGVRMRIALDATDEELARTGLVAGAPRVEVARFATPSPVELLIVDDDRLLLSVVHDPSRALYAQGDVAFLTEAGGLIDAQKVFFEQCWAVAEQPGQAPARPADAGSVS
jgi:sugar-specific transcriptional regulator TrmB